MAKIPEELAEFWHSRLSQDCPQQSQLERDSIVRWLLGEERSLLETLSPQELALVRQGMDYRYRILQQRYLGVSPTQAYRNLLNRLGSLVVLRDKIRTWVALSHDRQRAIADVLQEVIQEMLNSDRYLQSQIAWIAKCTADDRLRDSLLFTSLEEYCLRPIRNQPLLACRFVNYLRRQERKGLTQVPHQETVRVVSEGVTFDGSESAASLLDGKAIADYEESENWQGQQSLRHKLQEEFAAYLKEKVGQEVVQWLALYLQGLSPEEIAPRLNLPVKQVYRLREKVAYHAIRAFAIKGNPELVAAWLEISPQEHNLGLTPTQWQVYWQQLTLTQQQILEHLKAGHSLEAIAQLLGWKKSQVIGEWSEMYLAAQALRSQ